MNSMGDGAIQSQRRREESLLNQRNAMPWVRKRYPNAVYCADGWITSRCIGIGHGNTEESAWYDAVKRIKFWERHYGANRPRYEVKDGQYMKVKFPLQTTKPNPDWVTPDSDL